MIDIRRLAGILLGVLGAAAAGAEGFLTEKIEPRAVVELEWAAAEAGDKQELVVEPEIEIELPRALRLTAILRLRADAAGELAPRTGDGAEAELRELYLEASAGRAYLTIGKQQIVWGKADGLKVLDVVNPQDFREFVLDDFDDSRIPLWSLNAEIPVRGVTLQLVWVPDPTTHRLPEPGAAFELTSPLVRPALPADVPVEVRPAGEPGRVLADSDAGFRLSSFWRGWDLTFNYLYRYHDAPVFYRYAAAGGGLVVRPTYERTHLVGGTFSNAFGDLTLRGEVGYSTDRYFSTTDLADADGVVAGGELAYVVGLDWYGLDETLLSLQLFQNRLADAAPGVARETVETRVSFLAQRDFRNDTVQARILWLHDVDVGDGLMRPEVRYELRDGVTLRAGLDLFYGDREGLFGQFDRRDRLRLGIAWGI